MMNAHRLAALASLLLAANAPVRAQVSPGGVAFRLDTVSTGFVQPSSLVFLPDGRALVSDRLAGTVSLLDVQSGRTTAIHGVPANYHVHDAGLHDLVLHPDFARNHLLYLSYSLGDSTRSTLAVTRARLEGDSLVDSREIFTSNAWFDVPLQYGGRMVFVDSLLFLTVGEHDRPEYAQDLGSTGGKILRLRDDGSVPDDNPFVGTDTARAEIWSFGHRNPQGLFYDRASGTLWSDEHGPRHGDELNVIERGQDYGWARVSWGWQYDGGPIGMGLPVDSRARNPAWVWSPAIAPSGLLVYHGAAFPAWQGSLFVGGMNNARPSLVRLQVRGRVVVLEERILFGVLRRTRFVTEGPEGYLYLGNDDGQILRIRPR